MANTLNSGQTLQVVTFEGGYDRNFCYLVWCPDTRIAALVDAAIPAGPIQATIQEKKVSLKYALITHTHGDHLAHLEEWLSLEPQLETVGHHRPVRRDLPNYRGLPDGAEVELGRQRIILLETPGHYPDCVCWYHEEDGLLFSGDTVFTDRTGRTLSPLSDTHQLYHSVYDRILILPPKTLVYPGHNYGPVSSITLEELKASSDFFSCASTAQFEEVMARFEKCQQRGD